MQGLKSSMTYASRMLFQLLTGCSSGESEDDGNGTRHAEEQRPVQVTSMDIESKATQMVKAGSESEAKKALALVELRIAEGKATKKVLERVQKIYDERFNKELVTA
jgi:hypothetical protein